MHEPTALGEHFGPKATSGRCADGKEPATARRLAGLLRLSPGLA